MRKRSTAAVLAVCAVLVACDNPSTRDLTAPSPGVTHDAAALGTVARSVTRADGSVSSAPGTSARLSLHTPAVSAAVIGTTTVCDQGSVEEDTDENGLPNGNFFPSGGVPSPGTYDNIEVPPDEVCVLDGVTVTHDVTALAGSRLFIHSSEIGGNVSGLSARVVQLHNETTVGGNLDVQNGGDVVYPFASCSVENTAIQGNLSCTGNNPGSPIIRGTVAVPPGPAEEDEGSPALPVTVGGSVKVEGNFILPGHVLLLQLTTIGGNADVSKNTGAGFKSVDHNTVTNTIECKKNDPTFVGGPNVGNNSKGQCF